MPMPISYDKNFIVEVDEELLQIGVPRNPDRCAIALALKDKLGTLSARVFSDNAIIFQSEVDFSQLFKAMGT